jgi:RimJ/RimL family protein N-acetyltransferase
MQQFRQYRFKKMDEAAARQIAGWQYAPPYDIYNLPPDELEATIKGLLLPDLHYYSVWDETSSLIAFRCFGEDATVPGGDYSADALDMGGGLRPDLTGKGMGASIMEAAFAFARGTFAPNAFRATVAEFNLRALKVCEKVGYKKVSSFQKVRSGRTFVILMRDAKP